MSNEITKNNSIGTIYIYQNNYFINQGKTLGQGTFRKVKLATHNLTGEKVAIKILEKQKICYQYDIERVNREIRILQKVRHPNLIIETPKQLFLVMEQVDGGELFDFIVQNQRIKDVKAIRFYSQLISGIEYMHKLQIVYRDLKPENLIIERKTKIKIIDFGLSNFYNQDQLLKTACGQPCYAAPEMIAGKKYNGLQIDIWNSGVILFAMLAGYLRVEDQNTSQLYKKIMTGDFKFPKYINKKLKNQLRIYLILILIKIFHCRYSLTLLVSFLYQFNVIKLYQDKQKIPTGLIVGQHKINDSLVDTKPRLNISVNNQNTIWQQQSPTLINQSVDVKRKVTLDFQKTTLFDASLLQQSNDVKVLKLKTPICRNYIYAEYYGRFKKRSRNQERQKSLDQEQTYF
ncbi:unnamed protein product [Paramecium sonneborni]|uniref:Protein kinase domain-containing protein n=1 Tax=Paramecium sonneborni TaxID=65129 RepID=A0A8S1KTK1_9CILI|nr:unnamed protein product [Paramecium sonneborni]